MAFFVSGVTPSRQSLSRPAIRPLEEDSGYQGRPFKSGTTLIMYWCMGYYIPAVYMNGIYIYLRAQVSQELGSIANYTLQSTSCASSES